MDQMFKINLYLNCATRYIQSFNYINFVQIVQFFKKKHLFESLKNESVKHGIVDNLNP